MNALNSKSLRFYIGFALKYKHIALKDNALI